jgi:quercetin dioxygenase-like cupin family protein
MSKYDVDIAAGEYVLGILSPEQRHRFEERLENEPLLREQVARWEVLLSRLERDDHVAPPADLWSRVERALDQQPSASPFHTVRLDDGEWKPIRPGLERKLLYREPGTGTESYLFRMKPGALIEGHHHARAEECLVLEGDLTIGDLRLNAGDYHVAERGTIHPVLRSDGGAVMFVRGTSL